MYDFYLLLKTWPISQLNCLITINRYVTELTRDSWLVTFFFFFFNHKVIAFFFITMLNM